MIYSGAYIDSWMTTLMPVLQRLLADLSGTGFVPLSENRRIVFGKAVNNRIIPTSMPETVS